ncbi:NAD-dependent epimerase/dehydratase family protein [Homoserinimonas sp. A520]
MRILVTGAAGLVGGAVSRYAVERGHDVVRTWHTTPPAPLSGARDLRCDLGNPAAVASLPTDVDAIIHAAARIPAGEWSDDASASVNRSTDHGLLQHFSGAAYDGRWVYVSSVSLEHAELRSTSQYSKEKAEAEESAARAFPDRVRSLRISSPYGPGMRHLNVLRRFVEAALSGEAITLLGTGKRTQDFVHVDDVAAAALAAVEAPGGEPVVIASGQPVSMSALAQLIVGIAGSSSAIEHTGRPDPNDGFRADYDLRPAFEALGWAPAIRLEAGLRSLFEAM